MLLLIGLGIGLLLGLTGAGGSVFAVPLLMMLAGLPMDEAVTMSLGAVAASTLYGSLSNRIDNQVLWLPGLVLAISGMVTAPLGKYFGTLLPESVLVVSFSLLAATIAVRMWWLAARRPESARVVRSSSFEKTSSPGLICTLNSTGKFELKPRCISGLTIGGALVGLLSGLFGVGGGFLIVPLLMALSAVTISQAVRTSILIITLISSSGFISHLAMNPVINWSHLGWVSAGGVLGMVAGQALSLRIAGPRLQSVFAIGLLLVAITFVLERIL